MQLNDRELWAAVSSLVLPLIVATVQQPTWSSRTRAVVGFVGILVWTLLGAVYVGEGVPQSVDYHAWVRLFLVNALVAWGSFQMFWRPTGIVQKVEAATSPPSPAKDALVAEAERKAESPRDAE